MVKHVVLWSFNDKKDISIAKELLESLQGNVPHMLSLEVGVNFNENSSAYDLALITTHHDRASLEAYQDDSFHGEIRNKLNGIKSSRIFADFEA